MAESDYTEVTTQSWGSRLVGSFKGILVGFVLIGLATWMLFWNEGRAVRRAKALTEGAGAVVSVQSDWVDAANEGKLVHLSGQAETFDILRDDTFGIAVGVIHLERKVEMYQWRESESSTTKKKLGGGTETTSTYSYERTWSSSVNNSTDFKQPAGHENPNHIPYEKLKVSASEVSIGPFRLSPGLVSSMTRSEPLSIGSLDDLPGGLRWKAHLYNGGIYIGRSPNTPEVGDVRVTFEVVRPATVSIIARQTGNRLEPYRTSNGGNIQLLSYGAVPADSMFVAAQKANRFTSWIFRLLGFLLMAFGLKRILRPLSVLADVVPAIGNVVEASTGFVAYLLAGFLSLLIIGLAWLYHRPLLAATLLVLAGAVLVFSGIAIAKVLKRKKEAPAAA
jgi:hypothetical protein